METDKTKGASNLLNVKSLKPNSASISCPKITLKAFKNSNSPSIVEILLIMVHLESFSKGIPQMQLMELEFKSGGLGEPMNKGNKKMKGCK